MMSHTVRTIGLATLILAGTSAWADHHEKGRHVESGKVPGIELGARLSSNDPAREAGRASTLDRNAFRPDDRPERKVRVVYPAPNS